MANWLERHHLSHPLLALIPIALTAPFGLAAFGATFSVAFYYGREVAHSGNGRDPWWSGFNLRNWSRDNHLDFWPVLAVGVITILIGAFV